MSKSALSFAAPALLVSFLVVACGDASDDAPSAPDTGKNADSGATLPPPSSGATEDAGDTPPPASKSDAGSPGDTPKPDAGGGAAAPTCPWADDLLKMAGKFSEIQAGAPCDATCNAATHCCVDPLGSIGGGGGGIPGLDAGGGGGLGGPVCVTND